ncbi:MAG TPA: quinone-dependent dihydroorotate dehydrogenase [Thermoanaerobaculia bacterium]|nr:quinone-dependent dihydroorotate dehydrogenase [Thermoanaerobaculia bacterium]
MLTRVLAGLYPIVRPVLFRLDAESAHRLVLGVLSLLARAPGRRRPDDGGGRLRQKLLGLDFPNPVGLAAGFDKDASMAALLPALGFGFGEVGTVTPEPQVGNPRPRLFRYPERQSLRNSMGFNSAGMKVLARRLAALPTRPIPLGVNVGKNRDTPLAEALRDYRRLLEGLGELGDFFVVNVSSPNTPQLRRLQDPGWIGELMAVAAETTRRPVLLKLSPDLELTTAVRLAASACARGVAGIVVTNTTTDFALIPGVEPVGGLSGRVLTERSFEMLRAVAAELAGETLLVSVGGIDSGDEAYRRLRAGASLVELYTSWVFRGPSLVAAILHRIERRLDEDGYASIGEAVGADRR